MEFTGKCLKCASYNTRVLPRKCLAYESPKDCKLFIDKTKFSFDVVDDSPNKTNKTPGWYIASWSRKTKD